MGFLVDVLYLYWNELGGKLDFEFKVSRFIKGENIFKVILFLYKIFML